MESSAQNLLIYHLTPRPHIMIGYMPGYTYCIKINFEINMEYDAT